MAGSQGAECFPSIPSLVLTLWRSEPLELWGSEGLSHGLTVNRGHGEGVPRRVLLQLCHTWLEHLIRARLCRVQGQQQSRPLMKPPALERPESVQCCLPCWSLKCWCNSWLSHWPSVGPGTSPFSLPAPGNYWEMTRVAVSKLYSRSPVDRLLFVCFSDCSCFCLSRGPPSWEACSLSTIPSSGPGVRCTVGTRD